MATVETPPTPARNGLEAEGDRAAEGLGELLRRLREFDPIQIWAEVTEREIADEPFQLDEEFLARLLPLMDVLCRYFAAEVRGFENVPESGPVLLVGNHSGGILTPDTSAFFTAWYRHFDFDRPLVGLAFDAAFGIPGFRTLMRKIGEVPANRENARKALQEGLPVLVYPGGDHEIFRPWAARNRIDFGGRKGFVKLALELGVPVVPVVSHGGHDSTLVLTRGEELSKTFGLDRIRMGAFPIAWQIPWGISPATIPGFPLPAKITARVCAPMQWETYSAADARDPEVVERCYDEITTRMQQTLDELVLEHPRPILSRMWELLPFTGDAAPKGD